MRCLRVTYALKSRVTNSGESCPEPKATKTSIITFLIESDLTSFSCNNALQSNFISVEGVLSCPFLHIVFPL